MKRTFVALLLSLLSVMGSPARASLVPQSAMLSNQAGDSGSVPPVSSAVANRSPGLFRESSSCWKLFSFGMGRRIYSKWKWKCNGVPV